MDYVDSAADLLIPKIVDAPVNPCGKQGFTCCKQKTTTTTPSTPPPCDQGDGYQCSDIQVRKNSKVYKVRMCLCVSVIIDYSFNTNKFDLVWINGITTVWKFLEIFLFLIFYVKSTSIKSLSTFLNLKNYRIAQIISNLALESETLKHRKFVQMLVRPVAYQNQNVEYEIKKPNLVSDTSNHTLQKRRSGLICVFWLIPHLEVTSTSPVQLWEGPLYLHQELFLQLFTKLSKYWVKACDMIAYLKRITV